MNIITSRIFWAVPLIFGGLLVPPADPTLIDYNHQDLSDIGRKVLVDHAGNRYVAGTCETTSEGTNMVLLKYLPGVSTPAWVCEYHGAHHVWR